MYCQVIKKDFPCLLLKQCNEKSGYVTEPGNIKELAKKMKLLLNDSNMRKKFSIASFEKIKNDFDVIKQLEISNRLYHELTI